MAGRARIVQNSFTSGELTPRLIGRTDTEYYFNGLDLIENFIVLPQGGLTSRPGWRMVALAGDQDMTHKVRLIPFQFNDAQSYVLEAGHQYFRVYRNTGRVEDPPGTPVQVTTPYLNTEVFDLQFDQSADVMWLCHRAHKPQKLSRTSDIAWTIANYAPTGDPFTGAGLFPRAVAFWKSRLWFGGTDTGPNEFWASQVDDFENLALGTGLDDEGINGVVAGGKINVIRWLSGLDKQLFVGTFGSEMLIRGDSSGKVAPATVNINPATEHGVASLRPIKAAGYLLFLQRSGRKIRQLSYDFNSDAFVAPDLLLLAEHLATKPLVDLAYQEDADPVVWAVRSDGLFLGGTFLPTHKVLGWHRHPTQGTIESVCVIPHPDGDRDQVWGIIRRTINGTPKRFIEVMEDGDGYYGQYTLDCALHYEDAFGGSMTLSATTGTGVTVTTDSSPFSAGDVGKQIWHPQGIQHGALQITAFTDANHVTGDVVVPFDSVGIDTGVLGQWRKAVTTISGLGHLEGHTVQVMTDGATHVDRTVSGGAITLTQHSAQVEVGLRFTPRFRTLRPEVGQGGSIIGLTATRSDIKLRVIDTVTLQVNGQLLPSRTATDEMNTSDDPFTGDLTVPTLGWEANAQVLVEQPLALPATAVALMGFVWFGDE